MCFQVTIQNKGELYFNCPVTAFGCASRYHAQARASKTKGGASSDNLPMREKERRVALSLTFLGTELPEHEKKI
jgi:hypothetical protein